MNKKALFLQLIVAISFASILQSCVKEELDFKKVSNQVKFNPELYTPVIKGSLTWYDFFKDRFEDSTLISKEGSIYLYLKEDTIYHYDIHDFVNIPDQGPVHYVLTSPPIDIIYPDNAVFELDQTESFPLNFPSHIRVDSMYLNSGYMKLELNSNFSTLGAIRITIPSLIINNTVFDTLINFSRPSGLYEQVHYFPLDPSKLIVDNTVEGTPTFDIFFKIIQEVSAGEIIYANSAANMNLSFINLNEFYHFFGYAGDTSFTRETVADISWGTLSGISGTFAVTNPKIYFNYSHSFGFPIGFDLRVRSVFDDGKSVMLRPSENFIVFSPDYKNPFVSERLVFDRQNVSNMDSFLVFPPPTQLIYTSTARANPNSNTGVLNYASGDSKFTMGIEVEIPLELRANLNLRDTLSLDLGDLQDVDYIEYARLHYRIRNEFPIGFNASLILWDSIQNVHYDTLRLNETGNNFINAAPVDANGVSILNQVEEVRGSLYLDKQKINNMLTRANKVILIAKITSYDPSNVPSVKILDHYKFNLKTYLECEILYEGSLK
jgi:hypothetical protein